MSTQKQNVKSWWNHIAQSWELDVLPWASISTMGVVIFVVLLSATGFYAYRWYQQEHNSVAQQVFSECMEEYQKAVRQHDAKHWEHVQTLTKLGYEQNRKSDYAPYFLVLLSNVAHAQSDTPQAITLLEQALADIPEHLSIYNIYQTKLALMKMDVADLRTQGLQALENLAQDQNNKQRDVALYYVGLYYWTENNLINAIRYWNQLKPLTEGEQPSPWALKAEQLMQQVRDV